MQAVFEKTPPLGTLFIIGTCVLLHVATLFNFLALQQVSLLPALVLPPYFQIQRLVSNAFFHGGFFHILFNMLTLQQLGPSLEATVGTTRFMLLSLVLAFVAGLLYVAVCYGCSVVFQDSTWLLSSAVGFSGVLFAYATIESFSPSAAPTRSFYGLFNVNSKLYPWLLMAVLQIVMPNVSFLGHVTGILVGVMHAQGLLYCVLPPARWVSRAEDVGGCLSFLRTLPNFVPCPAPETTTTVPTNRSGFRGCPCWMPPHSGGDSDSVEGGATALESGHDWGTQGHRLGNGHEEPEALHGAAAGVLAPKKQGKKMSATQSNGQDVEEDEEEKNLSENARLLSV